MMTCAMLLVRLHGEISCCNEPAPYRYKTVTDRGIWLCDTHFNEMKVYDVEKRLDKGRKENRAC
jgi:hypothetical protein